MPARSIHVTNGAISFMFMASNPLCVCVCVRERETGGDTFCTPSSFGAHVGCFLVLADVNNAAVSRGWGRIHLFKAVFLFTSDKYPEEESLSRKAVLFLNFKETPCHFSGSTSLQSHSVQGFSTSSPTPVFVSIMAVLTGWGDIPLCFWCPPCWPVVRSDVPVGPLCISGKTSIQTFPCFDQISFSIKMLGVLYTFWMWAPYQIWLANFSSHLIDCLLILSMVSSAVQKRFSLI